MSVPFVAAGVSAFCVIVVTGASDTSVSDGAEVAQQAGNIRFLLS